MADQNDPQKRGGELSTLKNNEEKKDLEPYRSGRVKDSIVIRLCVVGIGPDIQRARVYVYKYIVRVEKSEKDEKSNRAAPTRCFFQPRARWNSPRLFQ